MIDPAIVADSLQAAVAVSLAPGLTRGMTVVDPSGRLGHNKVNLFTKADLPGVAELFGKSLG